MGREPQANSGVSLFIRNNSGTVKENMLMVLGHLLSLVPSEVQSRELPPLLPLLIQGKSYPSMLSLPHTVCSALDTGDSGLVDSGLTTIMQLNGSGSDTIEAALGEHLETLVDRFIKISNHKLNLRSSSTKHFFF